MLIFYHHNERKQLIMAMLTIYKDTAPEVVKNELQ